MRARFEAMNRAIEQHNIKPVIDSAYPLERVGEAYARLESNETVGKVVLTF